MRNKLKNIITFLWIFVLLILVSKVNSPITSQQLTTIVKTETAVGDVETSPPTINIPAKYDSREKGVITSVKSQASSNSCWAFAAISALESDCISKGLGTINNTDFSESHLVWFSYDSISSDSNDCSYNEGIVSPAPYDESGNWSRVTSTLARWSGIAKESSYPFPVGCADTANPLKESDRYINDSGIIIRSAELIDVDDTTSIKKWIMEHGSVVVSLYSKEEHYYSGPMGYTYFYNGENTSNHALAIIGWDDNFSINNFNPDCRPNQPGAWLCKDSQGTDWCNGGFSWVSYESHSITSFIGYTCQSAEKYDNNYTYNGYGWSKAIVCASNSYAANVFTANNAETLKAVSFYTAQPNTTIQVNIYTDLSYDTVNPTSGYLKYASKEILFSNWGYHTVDLGETIPLSQGTRFSVVIKFSHESGKTQIPVESPQNNITYKGNRGESYIYTSNYSNQWNDAQDYSVFNVCIQAFTKNIS